MAGGSSGFGLLIGSHYYVSQKIFEEKLVLQDLHRSRNMPISCSDSRFPGENDGRL